MRDKNRIEPTLDLIKKIWTKYPDLRLGQLILNTVQEKDLYYIEDDKLKNLLENRYNIKGDE